MSQEDENSELQPTLFIQVHPFLNINQYGKGIDEICYLLIMPNYKIYPMFVNLRRKPVHPDHVTRKEVSLIQQWLG